jgi:hypothetical protein
MDECLKSTDWATKKLNLYKKVMYNYNIDKYNYLNFYIQYDFDPIY